MVTFSDGQVLTASDLNAILDGTSVDDGSITNAKLAANSVTASKFAAEAWTDFSASVNATGFSSTSTEDCFYIKYGSTVFIDVEIQGTSNSTDFDFTLPFNSDRGIEMGGFLMNDNGSTTTDPGRLNLGAGSASVDVGLNHANANFTASSTKGLRASFTYEAE